MSIITKPTIIEKNTVAEFTLNKSVLAVVDSVVADSYFSNSQNWSEVLIYYKSSEGNQREILKFDATQASPTANFLVSEKARDVFQIQKIVIKDFDNDTFIILRTEINASDFDIMFNDGDVDPGSLLTGWISDVNSSNYQSDATSIKKFLSNGWNFNATSVESFSGDITLEFSFEQGFGGSIGFQTLPLNSTRHGLAQFDFGFFIGSNTSVNVLFNGDPSGTQISGGVSSSSIKKLKIVLNRSQTTIDFYWQSLEFETWSIFTSINYSEINSIYQKAYKDVPTSVKVGVAINSTNKAITDVTVTES